MDETTYRGHQLKKDENGKVTVTKYGRKVAEAHTEAEAERKVRARLDDEDES